MSVKDVIANGGVIPEGEGTPTENPEQKADGQLTAEELALKQAEEKKANMQKAIEQANSEYETLREQLKGTRQKVKELKTSPEEPEDTQPDQDVNALVQAELEKLKAEPRKQAISKFISSHEDLADETLRKEVLRRYELLKSSTEMNVEDILRDLNSAYMSLKGSDMLKNYQEMQSQEGLFMAGARVGGIPTGTNPTTFRPSKEDVDAAMQIAQLEGVSVNEVLERMRKRASQSN